MREDSKVALLGICYDEKSSYLRGAAEAPGRIREALRGDSTNTWSEDGQDVATFLGDYGDLREFAPEPLAAIRAFVSIAMNDGARPLVLGGDHSISFPVLSAVAERHRDLTIVHFDAHPDLYEIFEGDPYSHACPFARVMEAGLARRLLQVGIRTMNAHQREQAVRFGVEVIEARQWRGSLPRLEAPVYVSFDMDCLDPAFAPGVSHHEPGGLSTREAMAAIQSISAELVGADVVEFNPARDVNGVTAMVAAKLVKELAARMHGKR